MANTFKNSTADSVTTETVVYTGPASTQTTAIGMTVANTADVPITATVRLGTTKLVKDAPIAVGGTLVVIGGDQKLVVETGQTISVESTNISDTIVSVLEIT